MWSKTRQVLESRLVDDLKGRVFYHYDVYHTKKCKGKPGWNTEMRVLSIDEAIAHDNYFIRLLAVLDARLGKRRIKALADSIANEPEWFRKWILLRAGTKSQKSNEAK